MADWHLIVGLGNPGAKYADTRHNAGWMVLDELARRYSLRFDRTEHKSVLASGVMQGKKVFLAKPQTFMNLSGESVQPLTSYYKIEPERVLVVYDDMDLPLGTLRLRASGGAGGQKGMRSILQRMSTQNIARLRFGIGRPPGRMDAAAYVLQKFYDDDAIIAAQAADRAADAIETWLASGIEIAMNHHNGTVDDPRPGVIKPETTE